MTRTLRAGLLLLTLAGAALPTSATVRAEQAEPADAPEPGSELTVYHVVMGPGDAVWERFGHNAIRIRDAASGRDVAYNWGLFDFAQEDFVPRFIRGRMLYWMGAFDAEAMLEHYVESNRTVEIQELRLTPAQRSELQAFLEWNQLPENRYYHYDYFRDNCSTRVRDALDLALGGALGEALRGVPSGRTWRSVVREVTEVSLPEYLALDIGMGPRTDREMSAWEESFIPMDLRDRLRDVTVAGPEGERLPLVVSEETLFRAERPDVRGRSRIFVPLLLVLSTLGAAAMFFLARAAAAGKRGARAALLATGGGWAFLHGLVGAVLLGMWLGTDHVFAHRNLNLLQLDPAGLALAVLLAGALARRLSLATAHRVAAGVAALSALGLVLLPLPWVVQTSGPAIALALPLHLGTWWSLGILLKAEGASDG